jgi:hypothetical protein
MFAFVGCSVLELRRGICRCIVVLSCRKRDCQNKLNSNISCNDEDPRLNSRVGLALVCLLIVVSAVVATSLLSFRPASLPNINLTRNQIRMKSREVVNLHVTVLDSSERTVAWAGVNVTYGATRSGLRDHARTHYRTQSRNNRLSLGK